MRESSRMFRYYMGRARRELAAARVMHGYRGIVRPKTITMGQFATMSLETKVDVAATMARARVYRREAFCWLRREQVGS